MVSKSPGEGCGGVAGVVEAAAAGGVVDECDRVVVVGCGVDELLAQGRPGRLVGDAGGEIFDMFVYALSGLGSDGVLTGEVQGVVVAVAGVLE